MIYTTLIKINPENCRGCRRCQVACSSHDPGPLNPRLAGVQILRLEDGACDQPVVNVECLERFCGKVSPRDKAGRKPACVSACLFGALEMIERKVNDE